MLLHSSDYMAEPHDNVSQFEAIVLRSFPKGLTKSHAAKHVLSLAKNYSLGFKNLPISSLETEIMLLLLIRQTFKAQGYSQGPQNVGLMGNITNLQGQGSTTLPQPHEGALGMPMAISQGLDANFIVSNGRSNFRALIAQSENEVTTCLGADTEWFGEERQNN